MIALEQKVKFHTVRPGFHLSKRHATESSMNRALITFASLLLILLSITAHAEELTMQAELVRVVDGDTIVVNIAEWPPIIGERIGVRVAGCDTPELRDKRSEVKELAYKAKEAVQAMLKNAKVIELRNISRGKYFRLVADVYADGTNIANILIASGLAQPYDGGKKPTWQ